MAKAPAPAVQHDAGRNRFVLEEDGLEAELLYRRRADRLILIHTEVPDALGGRGIGARLVDAAVAFARTEQLTIVPWCPFTRRWLTDHPEAAEGVTLDWEALPTN